jgi:hypothetical protein
LRKRVPGSEHPDYDLRLGVERVHGIGEAGGELTVGDKVFGAGCLVGDEFEGVEFIIFVCGGVAGFDGSNVLGVAGSRPASVNAWLAGVRSFFAWLAEVGQISFNPAEQIKGASRKGTKRRPTRQALTDNEARRLLAQPDKLRSFVQESIFGI